MKLSIMAHFDLRFLRFVCSVSGTVEPLLTDLPNSRPLHVADILPLYEWMNM